MNLVAILLDETNTHNTPYDEGIEAYWDGKPPEVVNILYRENTTSYFEFVNGWIEACEHDKER